MMAHGSLCCLCTDEISSADFDLQKSCTTASKISLLTLLQGCITEKVVLTNYLICKMCYLLLNQLDRMKLKVKAIEDKLRGYICKYSAVKIVDNRSETNNIQEEECTVCFKKFNSKIFKVHLKTHQVELNEIETNFDFDEVNSLSEINPSLEDIHLLNPDETEEKHEIKYELESTHTKKTKKKNSNNVKPYVCSECPKTWKTLAELKSHLSSHSSERPYICEICGQAYKRQQALTIHVGMHRGINPYTCIYCNKSFTQKGALVRHTPIHTGELPFQCDLCGKRFIHHTSFNIHKLSHTGEKSHKCEICGLLLISGSHLKRHMRVHTGEKRFSCNTCGKKFAEKYNLAVHEKLHLGLTKKKKYQCHICECLYNSQVKLEEHLLNVHQKIQYSDVTQIT